MSIFQKPTAPGGESAGGKFRMPVSTNEPAVSAEPPVTFVRLPSGKVIRFISNSAETQEGKMVLSLVSADGKSKDVVAVVDMVSGVIVGPSSGDDCEVERFNKIAEDFRLKVNQLEGNVGELCQFDISQRQEMKNILEKLKLQRDWIIALAIMVIMLGAGIILTHYKP